ncbi:MAG: YabP/YqfC family sporulation protein, partial [Lachnospiraceae bacterium]|nr:YabP/YqfC family sporulation protein [Lachnospiraceae bacterium]
YGDVLLRLSGNREALIENYKGILLYTSEEVAIACKKFTLRICGCNLRIQYFSGSDMKVIGTINTISYLSNGDLCC